mgnify:FL=1
MRYTVVKLPLPASEQQIEAVINAAKPPGHRLVTMSVAGTSLILVFEREDRA